MSHLICRKKVARASRPWRPGQDAHAAFVARHYTSNSSYLALFARPLAATITLCLLAGCGGSLIGRRVEARLDGTAILVEIGGQTFTRYLTDPSQKYPYFFPVNSPLTGRSVTTETSMPFPHHRSLFFGCDRVNGGNYWQEGNDRGQIVSIEREIVEASGRRVVFTDRCEWRRPGEEPIFDDFRTVAISAPRKDLRRIDFEIVLTPRVDVTILKTNHSLFSARMAPELSVLSGGSLVNAEGGQGEQGTFAVASPWCDYSGTRDGLTEGLAILQHPDNRWFPSPWFTRDYGFFSPTPMYWLEGDRVILPEGEPLRLRYTVLVHGGDAESAGVAEIWRRMR